jgi:hypothetical protein
MAPRRQRGEAYGEENVSRRFEVFRDERLYDLRCLFEPHWKTGFASVKDIIPSEASTLAFELK